MKLSAYLPSLLISIGLLIVLLLLKKWLSPGSVSYAFWYNFLSCVQLIILFFAIIHLAIVLLAKKLSAKKSLGVSIVAVLLLVSFLEVSAKYLLDHPHHIPKKFRHYFHVYYDGFDMAIFQYESQCSQYDSSLFYSMKPSGRFVFSNREYADSFYTDVNGFRDQRREFMPDIICLGDSYTMGYGVGQDHTIPANIERLTGLKALNTGMSSFGTARQVLTLAKRDFSQSQIIIWQYCENDWTENVKFIEDSFSFSPSSRKEFERLQQVNEWKQQYFPAKHSMTLLKMIVRGEFGLKGPDKFAKPISSGDQAENFLTIIEYCKDVIGEKKIVLYELGYYKPFSDFIRSVKTLLNGERFKHLADMVIPLDVFPSLTKEDYYILDVHIKAEGNRKVAAFMRSTIDQLVRRSFP